MNKITITVGSVTYAIKAQKVLSEINISSKLIKIDASAAPSGCTHGLEIAYNDFINAIGILKEKDIPYRVLR